MIPDNHATSDLFIYITTGKLILTKNIMNETEIKMDISDLETGMYILRLQNDNNQHVTKKFSKE